MGQIRLHHPVLLMLAAFSRHEPALDWAWQQAAQQWGPIALASERFAFEDTNFYQQTMGVGLQKQLVAFERLVDPAVLVECKHQANQWEAAYRAATDWPELRPLNLDPGYLTEAKLVLATTKDRDHRVYLDRGIYAEVTLFYQRGQGWQARQWTYPDYRRPEYHQFLTRCRTYLRQRQ
jgi:hypothetical protein